MLLISKKDLPTRLGFMQKLPVWYAVYTRSRTEKKTVDDLTERGIEAYIPLRKVLRQWSDRKKLVVVPLINSYVFVRIEPSQYFEVLSSPGVVRYVYYCGHPAAIPEPQIDILKAIAGSDVEVESIPSKMPPGTRVRINAGPLCGIEGELSRFAGRNKVVIRIGQLDHTIMLTISPMLIEHCSMN